MGRGTSCAVAAAVRAYVEQLEARRLLAAVGPDQYGYTADAHAYEAIHLTLDTPGVISLIPAADDESEPIELGSNTFNFYGTSYTGSDQLFATSNGTVTFGVGDANFGNTDLTNSLPEPSIAALWDDWVGNASQDGQVMYKLDDTGGTSAPDRLIIQWNCLHIDGTPSDVTFQAILQLNTGPAPGNITLNYPDVDTGSSDETEATAFGASATVGIKDAVSVGGNPLLISFDSTNPLVGDGKAILISNSVTGQPHADAGPDISGQGGDTIGLDASASSDPNQSAASLNYAWDLDGDGIFGETGSDATSGDETGIHPTYTGPGVVNDFGGPATVTLRVTDSDHHVSYDTATIQLTPVPPTAGVTAPATGVAGVASTFTLTAHDPAQAGDFSFNVDWGDGNYDSYYGDSGTQASHVYADQGAYTVSVTVYDYQEMGSDPATATVTVGPRPNVLLTDDGTLLVTTGDSNDTIILDTSGSNARLSRNGSVTTYALDGVLRLDVQSGAGTDSITCLLDIPASIVTGDGSDTITTAGGDDSIFSGSGDDSISSGAGNDDVEAGDGNNTVNAGDGDDTINTGEGNDSIQDGAGYADINSNGGDDHLEAEQGYLSAGDGNDTIIGGDGGLSVYPGAGDNSVTTGAGNDVVGVDGDQADTISTGAGDDGISVAGNPDSGVGATIDSGPGDDSIHGYFIKSLLAGDGDDRITANFAGSIDAGSGDDFVRAGSNADHGVSVFGGDGNDKIFTGDGPDSLYGGAGRDTIHAGGGSDLLSGGGGRDLLFGQDGADRISGGAGNDRLEGGTGNDRLNGGSGADLIAGGDGTNAATHDDPLDELTDIQNDLV